ncbi:hypothetical protein Mapa_009539 [Marchantia paleacea]|nr:hypothetical protein Mapa_009539 [Marchantia paleacea]
MGGKMDRNVVTALFTAICILTVAGKCYGDPNSKLLRWSCQLESDTQLADTAGRHSLWPIPGRGKFATGGSAWTVCNPELDEATCSTCVERALKLAHLALDLLDIDSECSGEGVQLYLQSCKMRYVLNDFHTPPEVLYSAA